ncbi:MAG: type II toxin-antitoxin system VapC family toxin [Verrucomicrobiaceae bacterium]
MSTPYLDTGFALKRYVQEPNSPAASTALLPYTPPLPLTDTLEMELVNALHGKVHRRELTEAERDLCLASFEADIVAGFWQRVTLGPSSLRNRVVNLSTRHTPTLGTRTLDLLHVAAALELGCTDFLSFDNRQRQAAQAEGLNVLP